VALITHSLNQKAVYWEANGVDNYGVIKVNAPIELRVRWQRGRIASGDATDINVNVDSVVVVDRSIAVDSIFWLGAWSNLPSTLVDLRRVIEYKESPDIRGRKYRRVVLLEKWNDTLPTLA
jgi:hypothetical protein